MKYIHKGIGRGKKDRADRYLTNKEFEKLLASTNDRTSDGEDAFDLFILGGVFGFRVRECAILKLSAFDRLERNLLTFNRLKKRHEYEDTIVLADHEKGLLEVVARRRRERTRDRAKVLAFGFSVRRMQYMFTWYAQQAGILQYKPRVSFHAQRHRAGFDLWQISKDQEFVRQRMGHVNYNYLPTYIDNDPEEQRKIATRRKLPEAR